MSKLNRRNFLIGTGTTIALPYLASMQTGFSKEKETLHKMVFLTFGWGCTKETWFASPKDTGEKYKLPEGLSPLAKHKKTLPLSKTLIISSVQKDTGEAHFT